MLKKIWVDELIKENNAQMYNFIIKYRKAVNFFTLAFALIIAISSCEEKIELPIVSHVEVDNIKNNSVDVSCNVTNSGDSPIDTIGVCWSKTPGPSISDNIFALANDNKIDFKILGLIPKTKYYLRAFAINKTGITYGAEETFTTDANETDTFVDERDGQKYKTVKIGDQWWFAENINYYSANGSWYFNDDSVNYSSNGRLYNMEAALEATPDGWRLPTENDWRNLEKSLGIPLKEIDESHWRGSGLAPYLNENREFDFDVKWNGIRDPSYATLFYNDASAYFWTSTEYKETFLNDTHYYCRHLYETTKSIRRVIKPHSNGLSVRYVKN